MTKQPNRTWHRGKLAREGRLGGERGARGSWLMSERCADHDLAMFRCLFDGVVIVSEIICFRSELSIQIL